jgi:hypothetical protein
MAYREVTMVDVKEVLRVWVAGMARTRIAACPRLDPEDGAPLHAHAAGPDRARVCGGATSTVVAAVPGVSQLCPARSEGARPSVCAFCGRPML